jgi:MbtH protein
VHHKFEDDGTSYIIVVNEEEQYSIWPAERPIPAGWHTAGPSGTRADCLAWIEKVWTDTRPRSVRLRSQTS